MSETKSDKGFGVREPMASPLPTPHIPGDMQGRLNHLYVPRKYPDPAVRVRKIFTYPAKEGRSTTVTDPLVIGALMQEAFRATRRSELHAGMSSAYRRMVATDAFSDIKVSAKPVPGSEGEGVADLHVTLDEKSYSITTGVNTSASGQLEGYYEGKLVNIFGKAESISARVSHMKSDLAVSSAFGSDPLNPLGDSPDDDSPEDMPPEILSPLIAINFHKPTLGSSLTSMDISFRSQTKNNVLSSSFCNKVVEAEVALTDGSQRHRFSYLLGWRNIVPVSNPKKNFKVASSSEVAAEADSSMISAVKYEYVRDERLMGSHGALEGWRSNMSADVAGLGGDVSFGRLWAFGEANWTASRYMPDTGYQPALSGRQFALSAEQTEGLRPHPGPTLIGREGKAWTGLRPDSLPDRDYTWIDRVVGWISPGVTFTMEGQLGAMASYGNDLRRPRGTRIVDRFTLGQPQFKGFAMAGVGPRSDNVVRANGTTRTGDALGGDFIAFGCARLRLPPPFPSVRLAAAGVRTQLYACLGSLAPGGTDFGDFLRSARASAGLGLTVPFASGALEANFTCFNHSRPYDLNANFQVQLSG